MFSEWLWYTPILVILAGFLAGIINTVAGSGSLVTISLLVYLGVPSTMANGTNRIGVLLQTLIGAKTYMQEGSGIELPKKIYWQIVPAILGAIIGSFIAVELNEQAMNLALLVLMILMLILVLLKPKAWLKEKSIVKNNSRSILSVSIYFLIGIHGGFIQAGVGIFLLSALVLYSGYTLPISNAAKLVIVGAFTIPALAIFIYKQQVLWEYGILLAVGQSLGAYVSARFALKNSNANIYIRWLLIIIILASIAKFGHLAFNG